MENAKKHVFEVSIGLDLPSELVNQIAHAIQRAVLSELAGADLNAPLSIDFLGHPQQTESKGLEAAIGLPGRGPQGLRIAAR